jgi:PHP family Zn ribbon phosphoesterase
MALLKGLDIIALTDHNSGENVPAVLACAKGTDLMVVPGMELETQEEVHIICLFPDYSSLSKLQDIVYEKLPPIPNRPDIFGNQIIMDSEDESTGECDKFLITACEISVEDIFDLVSELGGVAYPAHIDRDSYSILTNLGGIPESYKGMYLELSDYKDRERQDSRFDRDFSSKIPGLLSKGYHFIKSSDAHYLGNILEAGNFLELEERSIPALLRKLGGKVV